MTVEEQYQLWLWWPVRGFATDSIRLASIEADQWQALRRFVFANESDFPVLSLIVKGGAPHHVRPHQLADIARECENAIDYNDADSLQQSALQTLSMFISQALQQREAGVAIDLWPGKRFETQIYIQPRTDLLKDLEQINRKAGQ